MYFISCFISVQVLWNLSEQLMQIILSCLGRIAVLHCVQFMIEYDLEPRRIIVHVLYCIFCIVFVYVCLDKTVFLSS